MKFLEKFNLPEESLVTVRVVGSIVLFFTLVPLVSFLLWLAVRPAELGIVILDKTVPDKSIQEHYSIHWILNHIKYTKANGDQFNPLKDYFGFFPGEKYEDSRIHDFSELDSLAKAQLVASNKVFYFSDTYGVYKSDFPDLQESDLPNLIYGGLQEDDLTVLEQAIKSERFIIAEFNSINNPTTEENRVKFEELTGIRWTGWITRYFDELDTLLNDELPNWMVAQYKFQHDGDWGFKGPGMVFLNEKGKIEILSYGVDILRKVPAIISPLKSQQTYNVPEIASYPYWVDIVLASRDFEVISYYDLMPTDEGIEKLRSIGLPRYFPAVLAKKLGENGRLFYFSGDFADNPVQESAYRFYGIARLWKMFLSAEDVSSRNSFFWNYYFPLMKNIFIEADKKVQLPT